MVPQQIFIALWVFTAGIMLTIVYLRGKKALEIFPNIESVKILFVEKGASGNSRKSYKSKFGGARNVLEIVITQEELWIRSPLIFAGFGKEFDLLHKVPLGAIQQVEHHDKDVVITFKTDNNLETTLDLKMKKAHEFVKLLSKNCVQQ